MCVDKQETSHHVLSCRTPELVLSTNFRNYLRWPMWLSIKYRRNVFTTGVHARDPPCTYIVTSYRAVERFNPTLIVCTDTDEMRIETVSPRRNNSITPRVCLKFLFNRYGWRTLRRRDLSSNANKNRRVRSFRDELRHVRQCAGGGTRAF